MTSSTSPTHLRRVGVFGGTFDPIHVGHLVVAEQCREQGRLDEVWFIPADVPPHKQGQAVIRFDQRVEMIELAIAGNPAFRVEPIERDLPGPNYTANTLEELHRRHPDVDFFLLVGSDSLADLPDWYEPWRVVQRAGLIVMLRAQFQAKSMEQFEVDAREGLRQRRPGAEALLRVEWVEAPPMIHIASSDLRRRIVEGRSIRYLVPRAVECYIHEKRLYQEPGDRTD